MSINVGHSMQQDSLSSLLFYFHLYMCMQWRLLALRVVDHTVHRRYAVMFHN